MGNPSRDRYRQNSNKRGYDSAWEKAAAQWKWSHPMCLGCLAIGVKKQATVVDHVIPHKGEMTLFWDRTNWQSSCAWHHNAVKPELEKMRRLNLINADELRLSSDTAIRLTKEKYRPAVGLDGFAIEGS